MMFKRYSFMRYWVFSVMAMFSMTVWGYGGIIAFSDYETKKACVKYFDADDDGELSYDEAASVYTLGNHLSESSIRFFPELQYFTALKEISDYAFTNCSHLCQITLPSQITSIGAYAFAGCSSLSGIKIPEKVTAIREYAFSRSGIFGLSLPDGFKYIGNCAFWGCQNFTDFTIPNSVTYIGYGVFQDCAIASLFFPKNVVTIGPQLFKGCTKLTSVVVDSDNSVYDSRNNCNAIIETATNKLINGCQTTIIPNTVTSLDDFAFYGCTGITHINIPNTITSIGKNAFADCTELLDFTFPDGVSTISEFTFNGCSKLNRVSIPEGVTSIEFRAFNNCELSRLIIPESVTSIESNIVSGCKNFKWVVVKGRVPPTIKANSFENSSKMLLYVPVGCKTVYGAASYWNGFKEIIELELNSPAITFADDKTHRVCLDNWDIDGNYELSYAEAALVKDIGRTFRDTRIEKFDELQYFTGLQELHDSAFYSISTLTSVVIPKSVKTIGNRAFSWCWGLKKIDIPEGVTYIDNYAFENCALLKEVNISYNVRNIREEAFGFCSSLKTITVDGRNTYYDSRDNCNAVIETQSNKLIIGAVNTVIPSTVTTIGWAAFNGRSILSIDIPNSVTEIQYRAFEGCSQLTTVNMGNGVTIIDDCAFQDCLSLLAIHLPNSTTILGDNVFSGCRSLSSVTLPENLNCIEEALFKGCRSLKSVVIPNGVTKIMGYAFAGCEALKSVNIPNNVVIISNNAFQKCRSLGGITIPNKVTSIGDSAFYDSGLNILTVEALTPPRLQKSTFKLSTQTEYLQYDIDLYVPIASYETYKSADYWKYFRQIIKYDLPVHFADPLVEEICVAHWDTNGDGKLGETEAAAVIDLGTAFRGNELITSFDELPYFTKLTTISANAFQGCSSLASIVIPDNVTSIGNNVFNGCTALSSITIPDNVEIISEGTFQGCVSLTSVSLPKYMESIGDNAFRGCTSLAEIKNLFKSSLESIGNHAFEDCISLKSFSLSNNVISIGNYAFKGCTGITSFYIPSNVKTIGDDAFEGCSSLTSVSVYCQTIGKWFSGITTITNLTIGNSVESIGVAAFKDCVGLTSIKIPVSVTTIGDEAFKGCSNLTNVRVSWTTPVAITADVFTNRSNATLTVPYGCTDVYKSADYWKDFLGYAESYISFADATVKQICVKKWDKNGDGEISGEEAREVEYLERAFKDNSSIKSFDELQYFANLRIIDLEDFYFCSNLEHIIIPNSVYSIGRNAFSNSGIKEIVIPNSVTYIGWNAFSNCKNLESVTLPDNLEYIQQETFYGCDKIETIVIPQSVKTIGYRAFYGCSGLESIVLPNKLEEIGNQAFRSCSSFTSVEIPASLSRIGEWVFSNCDALVSLKVDEANTVFDSRGNCNAIIETASNRLVSGCSTTVIPNSVQFIGSGAFAYFENLTEITIPNGVTTIEYGAFCSTGLTSVKIPVSVTGFGYSVFAECDALTSVIVLNPTPIELPDKKSFSNYANATLYVPIGCVAAYKSANYWKDFKEIVEYVGEIISFTDAKIKAICVSTWDTNGDGELSTLEAAAVEKLNTAFQYDDFTSFDEFRFFTGLTSIGEAAFYQCNNLRTIVIPDNVTSIGKRAFSYCSSLTALEIPTGVTSIGDFAFSSCGLTAITIPENVKSLSTSLFEDCGNLEEVILPEGLEQIGTCSFQWCSKLNTIHFPNTLIRIDDYALRGCTSLAKVTIPENVTFIGAQAFMSCDALTSVTVMNPVPIELSSNYTFWNSANATLYVPAGCKAAYQAAPYWQDFKEIKEIGAPDLIPLTVGVKDVTVLQGSFVEDKDAMHFDFEDDETMWSWGNSPETGIVEGSYNGSKYQATMNPSKLECWETQIAIDFDQLVPGEVYVLHFWAKADKGFSMNAMIQYPSDEAGYPSRGEFGWIDVGTEWKEYTLTTTVTGHNATRLILNIGELDNGTFCLDDISLRRKNPLFTLTYDGFVDGDDETTAFTTLPVATTTATNDSPVGTYPITISGGVSEKYSITYQSGTLTIVAPVLGDANGDGGVTITDAVAIVNQILGNPSNDFDGKNADVNHDGNITITDAVGVVNIILNNGGASSAPALDMKEPELMVEPE